MEIPLKVAELDHVVLRCSDQNRAYDFYTRILGLREERRIEQIGLIQLRAGRSMIDLVPASHPRAEGVSRPARFRLLDGRSNAAAEGRQVAGAGYTAHAPPR